MSFHPKSAIVNGKPRVRSTASLLCSSGKKYDSASKRYLRLMCAECLQGRHNDCEFKDCPCPHRDADLSFERNKLTAIGAIPIDRATVCPTVAKS